MINGQAILEDVLEIGNYTVFASYIGDDIYNPNSTFKDFTITGHVKKDTPITADVKTNGNKVVLTVNVNENATGFVKVDIGTTVVNLELVDGVATLTTTLPANSYLAEITYLGDENYNTNATKLAFTVVDPAKENTPISLDIPVDENNVIFKVNVNSDASGTVKFQVTGSENYALYVDVINGEAIWKDVLKVGNYTLTVTYMGDSTYNSNITSKDFEIIEHVMKNTPIDAKVESNANKVTLTVTVDEDATGFVEVKNGDSVVNIALENGKGTYTTTLPYGSYNLDITYLGDENYNKNSTKREFTLVEPAKENTPISLDVQTDENNAIITATVDTDATGIVKFQITGQEEYSLYVDVINGKATLEHILEAGNYNVVATYMGDDRFNTNITFKDFTVTGHVKKDTPISLDVQTDENNAIITATVDTDATGIVKFQIIGQEEYSLYVDVINGKATLEHILEAGNYNVVATYMGDDRFNTNITSKDFEIPLPEDADLAADAKNTTITVTVAENATGNILVDVNGTGYYAPIENGRATVEVIGLDEGTYKAVVTYGGDDIYAPANTTVAVTVPPAPKNETNVDPKANITVSEDAVIMELPEDATGYMLVDVDGTGYYVPVEKGTASFELPELAPGNHSVSVTYTGDKKYALVNSTETIEIPYPKETIFADDLVKVEKAADRFVANFTDSEGNPLANANVTFSINGAEYTRTTNANGQASIAINLSPGNYTITTTNPTTGDVKVNNITILSRFTEDSDLVKHYRNDSQYILRVLGDDGNPVGAGEIVTFNINGVFYNRTTNATGHVKLNINLPPDTYIITAEYKGAKVAHNVVVLPILTADNLSKKFGEPGAFEAHVYDAQGNPAANQRVEFNINGVLYSRTSGSDGIVKLNINLQPGEYIITSAYGGARISNTVTVIP